MTLLDAFVRTTRNDHDRSEGASLEDEPSASVPVRVSEGLASLSASLADELGADFDVAVGAPSADGIAVVAALGREAAAFVHAQHPGAVLLVVKRGPNGHNDRPADYLEAGADQYLETTSIVEISSHIRSLCRRLHRSSDLAESLPSPGRVKEAVGSLTDDQELKREGRGDRLAGEGKEKLGHVKDKIEDAIDKTKDSMHNK